MIEEWKPIKNYEGLYSVSNYGSVIGEKKGRRLTPSIDYKGYLIFHLYKDGIKQNKKGHRLVAEAFLPNPNNLPEVDHIDTDRKNNKLNNLRWASGSSNTRNRDVCRKAKSKFNGVYLDSRSGKYTASIWFYGKTKHLGTFTEEILAALEFNKFCIEHNLNRELNIITEV